MGWLTLGSNDPTVEGPKPHPAVLNYERCRENSPADLTPGALSPEDPCWRQLVALRRYQGRDPLGRDVYGPAGYVPRELPIRAPNYAQFEQTGVASSSIAAGDGVAPLLAVVQEQQRSLDQKKRELEQTKRDVVRRRDERQKKEKPFTTAPEWQIAAAAFAIGFTIGNAFGSYKSK